MKNPFLPLAARLYQKLKPIVKKKQDYKVRKALQQLYPLENVDKMHDDFQIKKLEAIFVIIVIGIVSAVCLHLCSRMRESLADGTQLVRNEWGVGDYKVTLRAQTENWNKEIPFLVRERSLTKEEQSNLQNELYAKLPDLIKKENYDLGHVESNLNLVSSVPGYPFRLTWSSSDNERINRNGKVNRKGIESKGEKIELTVTFSYEQEESSFAYEVFLVPEVVNEEKLFFEALENKLSEIDLEAKNQKQISLPDSLQDENIEWTQVSKSNVIFIFMLTILGCVLVGWGMKNDLEKSCKKRNRQLVVDYSGFVSKLRLYLSADLTVKNAFYRIMKDYEEQQEQKKKKYLYEEMKISCHQLENGVMEEQVYREFGKRCGETRYRRLSFLLTVHLKQGNGQLLMLLSEEADNAKEDRRNMARKAGEEAGTKLLFPMMLMLVVIMFLVLIPAYLDFGSI